MSYILVHVSQHVQIALNKNYMQTSLTLKPSGADPGPLFPALALVVPIQGRTKHRREDSVYLYGYGSKQNTYFSLISCLYSLSHTTI